MDQPSGRSQLAIINTPDGPKLVHDNEGTGITLDAGRPLDQALALACAQHGAASTEAAQRAVAAVIAETPEAFGSVDETQRCRVCGCGDLHACWPPCWWVEHDLCSSCHGARLHDVAEAVENAAA